MRHTYGDVSCISIVNVNFVALFTFEAPPSFRAIDAKVLIIVPDGTLEEKALSEMHRDNMLWALGQARRIAAVYFCETGVKLPHDFERQFLELGELESESS